MSHLRDLRSWLWNGPRCIRRDLDFGCSRDTDGPLASEGNAGEILEQRRQSDEAVPEVHPGVELHDISGQTLRRKQRKGSLTVHHQTTILPDCMNQQATMISPNKNI